ncbi:hypothetical protein COB55_00820 [Candidatus Wolfebacteria bacterium]|nr:MAG: hypothetical protein COB55_00820 [Candidatus Wolfebacteria bacterium]
MNKVLNLYKRKGETPLACIERFRDTHKEYIDVPMTYAGRLDPIAEGVLLVLAGEERYEKNKYLALGKEYVVKVLFGFSTDTYDILGEVMTQVDTVPNKKEIEMQSKFFIGTYDQTYPPYSSKTVNGKPLFRFARDGALHTIERPKRSVTVGGIVLNNYEKQSGDIILEIIKSRVADVKGDFRQEVIAKRWEDVIDVNKKYVEATFTIHCSSGTYVRTIVHELGQRLGIPACILELKRIRVGNYSVEDSE